LYFNKILKSFYFHFLILFLIVVFLYKNLFQNSFVWDDNYFILNWPALKNPMFHLGELIAGYVPLGQSSVYRPLRSLIYVLSYSLWETNPFGYHLQALIVYSLIIYLNFQVTKLITKNSHIALVSSFLFSLHPLNVEAVAWITASFDTIGNLFFFSAFYFYLKFKKVKDSNYLKYSKILFFFAAFTNELTLTFPLAILTYELLIQKQSIKNIYTNFRKYISYFIIIATYFLSRLFIMPKGESATVLFSNPFQSLMASILILKKYLLLMLWPDNLTVNHSIQNLTNFVREDTTIINPLFFSINNILAIILFLSLSFFIYFKRKKIPHVTFFLIASLLCFLPVLQIIPTHSLFFERYTNISLFFFSAFLSSAAFFLIKYLSKYVSNKILNFTFIVLFIFTIFQNFKKTQSQILVWDNEVSLWQNAYKYTPESAKVNQNLGLAYYKQNDTKKAINYLEKAIKLNPQNSSFHFSLANAYLEQQQYESLIAQLNSLAENTPQICTGIINLLNQYGQANLLSQIPKCQ
jgi:tetratricopeptide (TPR) repeat protein